MTFSKQHFSRSFTRLQKFEEKSGACYINLSRMQKGRLNRANIIILVFSSYRPLPECIIFCCNFSRPRILRATIARIRKANWLRFLGRIERHFEQLTLIRPCTRVTLNAITVNLQCLCLLPPASPAPGGRAVRRPAGPVIARRWIGPRIDCFRDSVRYCENATN